MRKLFGVIVCILLLLGLAACREETGLQTESVTMTDTVVQTEPEAEQPLLVGYGRVAVTPGLGVRMSGAGSSVVKIASGVWDELYATCIAFTDVEDNTILLFHMDMQSATLYSAIAQKQISEELGIPAANIYVAATHIHSGPSTTRYMTGDVRTDEWMDNVLFPGMLNAAKQAMEDRKPAEMYGASIEPVNLNFNRHYALADGTVGGDHFGVFTNNKILGHMVEVDNQMQLLCFKREGGKDVVLMNWQAHPHRAGIYHTEYTADVVGAVRDYVEAELECNFAYFTGASGNVNSHSKIGAENITADYLEQGRELGKFAVMALENMTKLETGKVQTTSATVEIQRIQREFYAFSIGDVGFAGAPYEMFCENGVYIKENSPFAMTFVVTCLNRLYGYFPSEATYAYESYEQKADDIPKGTAEMLADKFVEMLTGLYENENLTAVSGEPAPAVDCPVYWNLDRGTQRDADSDGSYRIRFLKDGQVETLTADSTLLEWIDARDLMGLETENGRITGVYRLMDMPRKRTATDFYVKSCQDNKVILNSHKGYNGTEVILELTPDVQIWDVSANIQTPVQLQDLWEGDRVTAVCDRQGMLLQLYVRREGVSLENLQTVSHLCQRCGENVLFYQWEDANSLPEVAGHFLLQTDVTLEKGVLLGNGEVCLDLNGKMVSMQTPGERVFLVQGDVAFTVQDAVGAGVIRAATSDTKNATSGLVVQCEYDSAVFSLYGGTLDAADCLAQLGTAVYMKSGKMEMYGGTIVGGKTYGSGSGCLTVGAESTFDMYGGTMTGGYCARSDTANSTARGGGIMRVSGTATIYGGLITAGRSDFDGGAIYVRDNAVLNMLGGTVTGSECSGKGAGIYLEDGSLLVLGGDAQIISNTGTDVHLALRAELAVHEDGLSGANVGISSVRGGILLRGSFTQADLACFTSDDPSAELVLTEEGIVLQKS